MPSLVVGERCTMKPVLLCAVMLVVVLFSVPEYAAERLLV
jgi:hypothetical protein